MRVRRAKMEPVQAQAKPSKARPRRLFAALWTLAIAFIALWLIVLLSSSVSPTPSYHSGSNHVARSIVDGDHIISHKSPERAAADNAALGRILLATHQRGCQTGACLVAFILLVLYALICALSLCNPSPAGLASWLQSIYTTPASRSS